MSFVGVNTNLCSLPPLLHHVNFRLMDNPLPRSRENTWEHDVSVLMPVEERDPDCYYKMGKQRAEEVRENIKQCIAKFELEITKKLVKSYAEDAADHTAQILAHFEPDSRQQAAQILIDFKNAKDWHTTESQEATAIDASTLTAKERDSITYSLALRKAKGITKEVMPWEEALDRINLTNYGVDISRILAYFKPNSRQQVVAKIFADNANGADNGWDRFRADTLSDSFLDDDPITEDPVVAACRLYDCGRSHLAEALTEPIFEGNLLESEDVQPEEFGFLKEGQYMEEHKEYWWIKWRRYLSERTRLGGERDEMWRLYIKSKRRREAKDIDTTAVFQIKAGPITRSRRIERGKVAERPQLQTTSERDRKNAPKAVRRKAKEAYRHRNSPRAMSVDVPNTGVIALSQEQCQKADTEPRKDIAEWKYEKDKWEPQNLESGKRRNGPSARLILNPVDRLPRDTLQSTKSATNNPCTLPHRSERLPKRKHTATSRKAIHPSKVSKTRKVSGGVQSTEPHMKDNRIPPTADRRRNKQEKILSMLSSQSTSQKPMQQSVSVNRSLRRSTRITKTPERFYSIYT